MIVLASTLLYALVAWSWGFPPSDLVQLSCCAAIFFDLARRDIDYAAHACLPCIDCFRLALLTPLFFIKFTIDAHLPGLSPDCFDSAILAITVVLHVIDALPALRTTLRFIASNDARQRTQRALSTFKSAATTVQDFFTNNKTIRLPNFSYVAIYWLVTRYCFDPNETSEATVNRFFLMSAVSVCFDILIGNLQSSLIIAKLVLLSSFIVNPSFNFLSCVSIFLVHHFEFILAVCELFRLIHATVSLLLCPMKLFHRPMPVTVIEPTVATAVSVPPVGQHMSSQEFARICHDDKLWAEYIRSRNIFRPTVALKLDTAPPTIVNKPTIPTTVFDLSRRHTRTRALLDDHQLEELDCRHSLGSSHKSEASVVQHQCIAQEEVVADAAFFPIVEDEASPVEYEPSPSCDEIPLHHHEDDDFAINVTVVDTRIEKETQDQLQETPPSHSAPCITTDSIVDLPAPPPHLTFADATLADTCLLHDTNQELPQVSTPSSIIDVQCPALDLDADQSAHQEVYAPPSSPSFEAPPPVLPRRTASRRRTTNVEHNDRPIPLTTRGGRTIRPPNRFVPGETTTSASTTSATEIPPKRSARVRPRPTLNAMMRPTLNMKEQEQEFPSQPVVVKTRSGRISRPPVRLIDDAAAAVKKSSSTTRKKKANRSALNTSRPRPQDQTTADQPASQSILRRSRFVPPAVDRVWLDLSDANAEQLGSWESDPSSCPAVSIGNYEKFYFDENRKWRMLMVDDDAPLLPDSIDAITLKFNLLKHQIQDTVTLQKLTLQELNQIRDEVTGDNSETWRGETRVRFSDD